MFLKSIRKFFDFIFYGNLFIAITAVCFTSQTQLVFFSIFEYSAFYFTIFFATLFEYTIHRIISVKRGPQPFELRQAEMWGLKNIGFLYMFAAASLIGLLTTFFFLERTLVIMFFLSGLITLAYSLPLLNIGEKLVRLRELPLLKIFLVSMVWSAVTILPPFLSNNTSPSFNTEAILFFIQRIFFVFAITVPFDIRDVERDKESGIVTLPLLYGEKNAVRFSVIACLMFVLIQLFLIYRHQQFTPIDFAMLLSGIITLVCLLSSKIRNSHYYHYGVLDGCMLLQFLLVLIFGFG